MQTPPIQGAVISTVSVQNQKAGNADGLPNNSAAPDTAQAVPPVAQSQLQNQTDDSLRNRKLDEKALDTSLKQLNDVVKLYNSQLEFSVDKDTNIEVVKVVDKDTQKVIRQIPSEDAIRIAKAIGDFKGLLLKDEA